MTWMAQHWLALALLGAYTGMLFFNAYLGNLTEHYDLPKVSKGN